MLLNKVKEKGIDLYILIKDDMKIFIFRILLWFMQTMIHFN